MNTNTALPDSSDLLALILDEDLHDLYAQLGKAISWGNQAEQDVVKELVLKLHAKLSSAEPRTEAHAMGQEIYELGLHGIHAPNTDVVIYRVAGGWIYRLPEGPVFVPFDTEFRINKNSKGEDDDAIPF